MTGAVETVDDLDDIQCEDYYGEENDWSELQMTQKIMDLGDDGSGERTQSLWLDKERGHLVVSQIPYDKGWETMIFQADDKGNVTDWIEVYCSREYETHAQSIGHFCNKF